jgi:hypothetical protein
MLKRMPTSRQAKKNSGYFPFNLGSVNVTKRYAIRAKFTILVLVSIVAGCGLESSPSIEPPPPDTITIPLPDSESVFSFGIPTDNNPEYFEGFELYYKLYFYDSVAPGWVGQSLSPDEESEEITIFESLAVRGFNRLYGSSDPQETPPLIPLELADKSDAGLIVELDFSNLLNGLPINTYDSLQFGRLILVDTDSYVLKGFAPDDFVSEDPDLQTGLDLSNLANYNLYVSLFAISYGNNIITPPFNFNIRSAPVYLGNIQLSFSSV